MEQNKEVRSKVMRAIRSRGNLSTEWRLRASLVSKGIKGWHLNDETLPGTPDIVFEDEKLAIFLDGCFWHGCPKCYRRPKSSQKYWDEKLQKNIKRDIRVRAKLRRMGWHVYKFWEHSLEEPGKVADRILSIRKKINKE